MSAGLFRCRSLPSVRRRSVPRFLNRIWFMWVAITMVTVTAGCQVPWQSPTPPPGWESDVRDLFVEDADLPARWRADLSVEAGVHRRANHVRRWFGRSYLPGVVIQDIWRAYTTANAEDKFNDLARRLFHRGPTSRFPSTSFAFPAEVSFRSKVANEWGLTCGVDVIAECFFAARYRNYVVSLYVPLQERGFKNGLTYSDLANLLEGVDEQFVQHLAFPVTAPREPLSAPRPPMRLRLREPQPGVDDLLLDAASLPAGWETAFPDWEGTDIFEDGTHISTRNFRKGDCYSGASDLEWCYVTQFAFWFPSARAARREWASLRSVVDVGDPASSLGVLRIPGDITPHGITADEHFVACVMLAGGEQCEAALLYGSYLLVLQADTVSTSTMMGHSRHGLTHGEFAMLVQATDTKVAGALP